MSMENEALWIISVIGAGALLGVFRKMNYGFGPMNLRIVGIVLVALFSTILGVVKPDSLEAAIGILGAIAGYLFGTGGERAVAGNSAKMEGSVLGAGAKFAGGNITETVNQINAKVDQLSDIIKSAEANIRLVAEEESTRSGTSDFLVNVLYDREVETISEATAQVVSRWQERGWSLQSIAFGYNFLDGMLLVFSKPSTHVGSRVSWYRGPESRPF